MTFVFDFLLNCIFKFLHSKELIFNCTWEDPAIDLIALNINRHDNLLAITSAGCNILTYVLQEPNHIYAIDLNPCQNALLQLKLASIRELDFDRFWQMWGCGRIHRFTQDIYYPLLRKHLTNDAKQFWDKHKYYFEKTWIRKSFYWRGCSGLLAYLIHWYLWFIHV